MDGSEACSPELSDGETLRRRVEEVRVGRVAWSPEELLRSNPTSARPGRSRVSVCRHHLDRTSGVRLDCTVTQSTFNLPGAALSPPAKVIGSARTALPPTPTPNTNSGGGLWPPIIDGSWLEWMSSLLPEAAVLAPLSVPQVR